MQNRKSNIPTAQKSLAEVREAIDQYLKDVKYELTTHTFGITVYVNLVYYDFKPRRIVRNEIENIAPNIEVDEIRREYSTKSIVAAYYDDSDCPQQIFVRLPNGEMVPTDIHTLLTERMARRDYCERA